MADPCTWEEPSSEILNNLACFWENQCKFEVYTDLSLWGKMEDWEWGTVLQLEGRLINELSLNTKNLHFPYHPWAHQPVKTHAGQLSADKFTSIVIFYHLNSRKLSWH